MVYGYVRVSTTGQVPGTSLQEQAAESQSEVKRIRQAPVQKAITIRLTG